MELAMAVITEGFNSYVERDGKRELINPESTSMRSGDDEVFRFDGNSGLLELSMSQRDIDRMIQLHGGLPIAQMFVPPLDQIIQNVRNILPLPKKDGTFLISLSERSNETRSPERKGLLHRIFG